MAQSRSFTFSPSNQSWPTSARVLVEDKKRGLVDNVGAALQAVRDSGYWISDSIVGAALKQTGET